MDDLSQKLAELLNDEESLKQVRDLAESILGNDAKSQKSSPQSNAAGFGDIGIEPAQLAKIMSIVSRIKNNNADNRANLLLALKPMLSAPRREKVDTAIKLLKLIDLLPILKENGIFEL